MFDTTGMQAIVHIIGDLEGYYETIEDYEDLTYRLALTKQNDWIELDLGHSVVFLPIRRIECVVPFKNQFKFEEKK